jgi:hypothetical protein
MISKARVFAICKGFLVLNVLDFIGCPTAYGQGANAYT